MTIFLISAQIEYQNVANPLVGPTQIPKNTPQYPNNNIYIIRVWGFRGFAIGVRP